MIAGRRCLFRAPLYIKVAISRIGKLIAGRRCLFRAPLYIKVAISRIGKESGNFCPYFTDSMRYALF